MATHPKEATDELDSTNEHLDCLKYMRESGLEWNLYDKYLGSTS